MSAPVVKMYNSRKLAEWNLSRLETELAQQQEQLYRLREYKDEYSANLKERMAGEVTPDEIQDYRYFFASLYKAISQQESTVNHLIKHIAEAKANMQMEAQP